MCMRGDIFLWILEIMAIPISRAASVPLLS